MLKAPKTQKSPQDEATDWLRLSASSMQGWRWYMEDACTLVPHLTPSASYVGVFDGHTTTRASQFCAQNLHSILQPLLAVDTADPVNALDTTFLQVDRDYLATLANPDDPDSLIRAGGSTATVVLLDEKQKYVTVAGIGDSRCVLSRGGVAINLTRDHKPYLEEENLRITRAGGKVSEYGRLGNTLNVSRGIGDFAFKVPKEFPPEEQQLTASPQVIQFRVLPEDEFVVVATDGLWECMSNRQVVDFVRERLDSDPLSAVCDELMDACIKKKNPKDKEEPGTSDNITVVIAAFKK